MGKKHFLGNMLAMALASGVVMDNVPFYRAFHGRSKYRGERIRPNRYGKPHQGEREIARRRKQIENGMIPEDQIYRRRG